MMYFFACWYVELLASTTIGTGALQALENSSFSTTAPTHEYIAFAMCV